ncbi:MAG: hypothetical protein ACRC7N_10395 [Clostridium sp.]
MARKKSGSSLILVMMISAIFLVISSVVTTAVMTTTRANASEQRYEDLLYGAESGIESAFAKIHRGEYSNSAQNEVASYVIDKDSSGIEIFKDYIVEVNINETNGNTYNVRSKAISRSNANNKREVAAKVTKPVTSSTNIFKYLLFAEKMDIKATGEIDDLVTLWSVDDYENSEILKDANSVNEVSLKHKLKVNSFQNFVFSGADAPIHSEKVILSPIGKAIIESTVNELANSNDSVKKITYKTKSQISQSVYIYLVNTDQFILEAGTIGLDNVIIITNGSIVIRDSSSNPTGITLNKSTFYGREFNFNLGAFTSQYRLIDNIDSQHDLLIEEDVVAINELIKQYIPLWGQGSGGGGVSDTTVSEYEY